MEPVVNIILVSLQLALLPENSKFLLMIKWFSDFPH